MTELARVDAETDGRHDFDFFIGSWDSQQRKLRQVLAGCDEWVEFSGASVAYTILDGLGHFDEVTLEAPGQRVVGATVRLFDPQTRLWRLYWSSTTQHEFGAPQVGRFEDGRGEFYAHEVYQGRPIFCRYLWISSGPDSCHWEQAFSVDAGRTWETNWIADFHRHVSTIE